MICLADNDIVKKLAVCNLLDEAVEALGVTHEEILVLPTMKFVLGIAKNPEKTRAKIGNEGFDRLKSFLASVGEIAVSPSAQELRFFDDSLEIDTGEAVLFSASAHYSGCLIATGDKRSLRALVSLAGVEKIVARLAGRVICFEQIVLRIIDHSGFELVRRRVVPVCDCDTVLGVAFGSGLNATEDSVRRSLSIYVGYLRNETGAILIADDAQLPRFTGLS